MHLHTLLPRTGSYEKMYDNNYATLYVIYSGKMINWAKVILDDIKSFNIRGRKTMFYASYLTKIFIHFGIDVTQLQDMMPTKTMDQKSISLTKLPSRMVPIPPYDTYIASLVRETLAPSTSQPSQLQQGESSVQISEDISWSTDDDHEISLFQPSQSMNTSIAILKN